MIETTNRLTPIDALLGKWGRTLSEILHDKINPKDKIDFIQNRLVELLRKKELRNPLVEYCVNSLKTTNGLMSISELERKTGYSRRYFEILLKITSAYLQRFLRASTVFRNFTGSGQADSLMKK